MLCKLGFCNGIATSASKPAEFTFRVYCRFLRSFHHQKPDLLFRSLIISVFTHRLGGSAHLLSSVVCHDTGKPSTDYPLTHMVVLLSRFGSVYTNRPSYMRAIHYPPPTTHPGKVCKLCNFCHFVIILIIIGIRP